MLAASEFPIEKMRNGTTAKDMAQVVTEIDSNVLQFALYTGAGRLHAAGVA